MTTLFDSLKIGEIVLKNRIIMAPMTRSRADDDGVQPDFVAEYYAQRAAGGLLITEAVNVSPMAKGYVRTPGIYTAEQLAAWRKVSEAVHAKDGKIFMQIFHTGRIALPDLLPGNAQPVAPSAVAASGQNYTDAGMKDFVEPRELSSEEIEQIIKDFGAAAKNAVEAGFDGVELHGANGYLVHQFLGTNTNLRTDRWGGSFENRARFLFGVLNSMIDAVGAEKVAVRLSPAGEFNDMRETDAEELYTTYILPELSKLKLAYLHIGTFDFSRDWHAILRPVYDGVYLAGVGFTKERAENLLAANGADAIVFGTSFLANPDLPDRLAKDSALNTPDQSTFYTPGEKGYTDYPFLSEAAAA